MGSQLRDWLISILQSRFTKFLLLNGLLVHVVSMVADAQLLDVSTDREMSTELSPIDAGFGLTSTGEAGTDCSCTSMNLVCASESQYQTICGSYPRPEACALNGSTCEIVMPLDTCRNLGLSSTTAPVPVPTEIDCTTEISGDGIAPEKEAERARQCCIFKHEVIHVTDPICWKASTNFCHEAPAYEESTFCQIQVTQEFCKKYPSHKSCNDLCREVVDVQVAQSVNQCICDNVKLNGDGSQEAKSVCAEQCVKLEPMIPLACPKKLEVNVGKTVGDSSLILSPDEYSDKFCKSLFPTVKVTPSPTPAPTPVPIIVPDPTPVPTPEPNWNMETSTELAAG